MPRRLGRMPRRRGRMPRRAGSDAAAPGSAAGSATRARCSVSASASSRAMIATPRSASRYRLSQAMPSSAGSRHTRRSVRPRCVASGEWFRVDPLAQRPQPAPERRRGLGTRVPERGVFERGDRVAGQGAREFEQGADLAHAHRPARECGEGRGERPGQPARVGDQATRGRLMHRERGRELGHERPQRELPLGEPARLGDPVERSGEEPGRLDALELLGLRGPDHPIELSRPASTRHPTPSAARVPVGWSWVNSTTTHRHSNRQKTAGQTHYSLCRTTPIPSLWRTSRGPTQPSVTQPSVTRPDDSAGSHSRRETHSAATTRARPTRSPPRAPRRRAPHSARTTLRASRAAPSPHPS